MGLLEKQQLRDLVRQHSERLEVDPDVAFDNFMQFAELVSLMESDGDLMAENPQSSAKGLYQFLDISIDEAAKRTMKYIPDAFWLKIIERGTQPITKLDKDQQTLLFLGDMLEKSAVVDGNKIPGLGDELMKRVAEGSMKGMKAAYEFLHHTDPDDNTKKRMNKYFGE